MENEIKSKWSKLEKEVHFEIVMHKTGKIPYR